MGRPRATEQARSRSKAVLIDEISRGIEQFQDILVSIEDFSREGFPYRDAARAKAELQLRECVRRIFGERSPEFQTCRNHKLRTANKADTAQSIALVKTLIHTLDEKKLELQGLKPPTSDPKPGKSAEATPHMTLVPPTATPAPTSMPPQPVSTTPPMTVSVAMTTNLGTPATPTPPSQPSPFSSTAQIKAPSVPPPIQQPPSVQTPAVQPAPAVAAQSMTDAAPAGENSPPSIHPSSSLSTHPAVPPPPSTSPTPPMTAAPPVPELQPAPVSPLTATVQAPVQHESPSPVTQTGSISSLEERDPLELIRKVCLRFHAVTRQLRLRKDYRATLEVEDDYDLQDLLCALLKVEFDEVGTEEWTPPYTQGAPRTAFLLHRDQIVVVAKKTRPGLTTKEIADQVTADAARYSTREKCTTLFCFIYDPEGRIGSPKRLETDLTSVSDRYMTEVLVAPK